MKRKLDLGNCGLVELNPTELQEINGGTMVDDIIAMIIKILHIPTKTGGKPL